MRETTATRALAALALTCSASAGFSQALTPDDPNIEPEVVEVRAAALLPRTVPAQPALLLPRPHIPNDAAGNAGPGYLNLGDIPFNAAASATEQANLWERIRASFALQELPSPLVKDWESWYASRPDYVARMVARAERYLYYIVEEVEKRGMPSEIALLPMIESAYNPKAYSTAHASGIWQFIPSTGKNYGLKQNWWQDERRDVLAATRAALDYLEKLYEMFGSWELALASYNWGEGAVGRAVQRNEAKGLRTDYMSLDMPAETRNYIPKLMAVKNIIARPESFGLTLADVQNRPYFTVVSTDKHIDVKVAAKLANMPVEEFQALNPSHNRPVIRAETSQQILLPTDRAETFQSNLQSHDRPLTSWQSYRIEQGDRIERIAQRFGIALSQLKEVNSIPARLRSLVGLTILVPSAGESAGGDIAAAGFAAPLIAPVAGPAAAAAQAAKHVVKAGETLASIAQRYKLSVAQLAARNGIHNGRIRAGQTLALGESAAPASEKEKDKETAAQQRTRASPSRATPAAKAPVAAKSSPSRKRAPQVTRDTNASAQVVYARARN